MKNELDEKWNWMKIGFLVVFEGVCYILLQFLYVNVTNLNSNLNLN